MIKVLQSGLFTTIQDTGRFGFRNYGVPNGGVMDSISASLANSLLNNHLDDAVLEITLIGPKIEFLHSSIIAITGATSLIYLNADLIRLNKVYTVAKGDILSFGVSIVGVRTYLAVKNGFKSIKILNSRSLFQEITPEINCKKGSIIPFDEFKIENNNHLVNSQIVFKKLFFETSILEVYKGPDFNLFSSSEMNKIIKAFYTISVKNSRMGYYFNEAVLPHSKSIITNPVLPGTIQLIPSGNLIVLMKDAQTTGGYPRVLQLSERSICILAQKGAGESISFKLTEI
ncbi:biotin-dependent carboxyltransferase family protein [Lutibacter sp.]|uniref:5-oxoprolinase subunit C family protein n=1 Tax=Lutibacter sp. TaxID=1925666 RepID=UPI0027329495|nr:biotin-dependent carboxyltransferase family protein [Lutibacter sp.]MDP3313375.1 biotin-dependent carboxyltransferase family protein [Lutibacter sp.]